MAEVVSGCSNKFHILVRESSWGNTRDSCSYRVFGTAFACDVLLSTTDVADSVLKGTDKQ